MSDLILNEDALVVPKVGGAPVVFDMRKIHRAEARLCELASITRPKAGELLHTFIDAWGDARDYLATLRGEFGRAKQKLRSVRGAIVLDEAAETLKAKGLASSRSPAGSEDLRDAVVNTSKSYLEATDLLAQIEAAVETMDGKTEKLKMAYFAVNKLIDGPAPNRDLSGGAGDDDPGSMSRHEKVEQFVKDTARSAGKYTGGFGAPKL